MKKIALILSIIALVIAPFFSKAQLANHKIRVTYSGYFPQSTNVAGTFSTMDNNYITYTYSVGTSHDYSAQITNLTLYFTPASSTPYIVAVSKSALDAIAVGNSSNFYVPGYLNKVFIVTKGPGYSIAGSTFDYSLDVKTFMNP